MRQEIFVAILLLCCAYAIWRGGAPERMAAGIFLVAALLSATMASAGRDRFGHEEYGVLATDTAMLVVVLALALRSRRWWPLFLAALQLDGVLVHLMYLIAPKAAPIAYLDATALWSYPMVLILAAGTWRHQNRLARWGEDIGWKAEAFPRRRSLLGKDN